MNVKLKPFQTPNFVLMESPTKKREEGFKPDVVFSLVEVDTETLSAMCDAFRADVFRKAEKKDPRP